MIDRETRAVPRRSTVALAILVLALPASGRVAWAQGPGDAAGQPRSDRIVAAPLLPATRPAPVRHAPLAGALRTIDYSSLARASAAAPRQGAPAGRQRSTARKIIGGAIGAAAGFFAGGYLGAAIEGDRCHCDDPGLKGALIGAPIGAVTGGVLGALFF